MSIFLRRLDPVLGENNPEIEFLKTHIQTIEIKKGTILQRAGDQSSSAYFVKKGLLRSYSTGANGKEHIFMFAPEDWIIADSNPPGSACELYIDALEDSIVEALDKRVYEQAVRVLKTNHEQVYRVIRRVSVLQKRVIMLMSATALERYEHFLEAYPDIIQRVPQKMIASYLGITPEALSKVKGDKARRDLSK